MYDIDSNTGELAFAPEALPTWIVVGWSVALSALVALPLLANAGLAGGAI